MSRLKEVGDKLLQGMERVLEANILELGKLRELESKGKIKDLSLIHLSGDVREVNEDVTTTNLSLSYRAIGTSEIYPNVRINLINKGVIKKHQVEFIGRSYHGEQLSLNCLRRDVRINLKVYDPNCKFKPKPI